MLQKETMWDFLVQQTHSGSSWYAGSRGRLEMHPSYSFTKSHLEEFRGFQKSPKSTSQMLEFRRILGYGGQDRWVKHPPQHRTYVSTATLRGLSLLMWRVLHKGYVNHVSHFTLFILIRKYNILSYDILWNIPNYDFILTKRCKRNPKKTTVRFLLSSIGVGA